MNINNLLMFLLECKTIYFEYFCITMCITAVGGGKMFRINRQSILILIRINRPIISVCIAVATLLKYIALFAGEWRGAGAAIFINFEELIMKSH